MQLTEHFTLEEMTVTSHRDIDNTPSPEVIEKLKYTARGLEHVRILLGVPVLITSGYRCAALNDAVGGSASSQHMQGEAADFVAPSFGSPYEIVSLLQASQLAFDQLIYEGTWVHCSFVDYRKPRLKVNTWVKGQGYLPGLVKVGNQQ